MMRINLLHIDVVKNQKIDDAKTFVAMIVGMVSGAFISSIIVILS